MNKLYSISKTKVNYANMNRKPGELRNDINNMIKFLNLYSPQQKKRKITNQISATDIERFR